MAIVKRYNPNKFFFPERLNKKLESILDNKLTVVEAPTGFGKTTSIRNLLNISEEPFIWINIENESKTEFYEEFCNYFQNIDSIASNKLKSVGFPTDYQSGDNIVKIISESEIDEKYIFVFDNYQYISDEYFSDVISKLARNYELSFKFIIITQSIKTSLFLDLLREKKVNYIGKNDLEFTKNEIKTYFRSCGIKLVDKDADYLYKYTEGWISAIYLQLLHYISNNTFEPDAGIDKLVCKAIWDRLSNDEQEFLLSISIFDSFSLKQAIHIGGDDILATDIKRLLNSNSFIRFDTKDRKYYEHAILRYFLKTEFEKMDKIQIKKIYNKAAKWYEDNENYYMALKYYYEVNNFSQIYNLNISINELLPHITKDNKEMLINIILRTPYRSKEDNIRTSIVFCFVLFMYNEKDFFNVECKTVYEIIQNSKELREREREILIGEIKFIYAYIKYNDIEQLDKMYSEAYNFIQSPVTIFPTKLSLTFKNPSVLCCFHRESGKLNDEVKMLDEMMITYYKLTAGNSKGLEALMRAEVLFNRCDFEDSEVLCQKALYMAETRNQVNVYISTMFLMERLAVMHGNYEEVRSVIKSIRKKIIDTGRIEENYMADICEAFMYMNFGKPQSIPKWLKSDKMIEEKSNVLTLGFCNIIYGKYLILNEEYTKLLGISGQMLGTARVYNNIMYEIYIYIYISIANYWSGNNLKSVKFVTEAIKLASKDKILMPFIENFSSLSNIFKLDMIDEEYRKFISTISSMNRRYDKYIKTIISTFKSDTDYGLTKREFEVAKLAAERYTNKEIAEKLFIAESTVKSNLKTIFSKLQIKSRAELKKYY